MLKSLKLSIILIVVSVFCCPLFAQDDGMPFGKITDTDIRQLTEFSKKINLDLEAEMTRVYGKDKPAASKALGRLFKFSLVFKTFDINARTYSQIIYSGFLNLGESGGVDFIQTLENQPLNAQQRIRDILFYAMLRVPKEHQKESEKEIRKMFPTLFPESFQFGNGDPLFTGQIES